MLPAVAMAGVGARCPVACTTPGPDETCLDPLAWLERRSSITPPPSSRRPPSGWVSSWAWSLRARIAIGVLRDARSYTDVRSFVRRGADYAASGRANTHPSEEGKTNKRAPESGTARNGEWGVAALCWECSHHPRPLPPAIVPVSSDASGAYSRRRCLKSSGCPSGFSWCTLGHWFALHRKHQSVSSQQPPTALAASSASSSTFPTTGIPNSHSPHQRSLEARSLPPPPLAGHTHPAQSTLPSPRMDAFFAEHGFPLPHASAIHPHTRFLQLVAERGWKVGSRNHRRATAGFHSALLATFAGRFGSEAHPPLETWQRLCAALGAREMPKSITKCKQVGS